MLFNLFPLQVLPTSAAVCLCCIFGLPGGRDAALAVAWLGTYLTAQSSSPAGAEAPAVGIASCVGSTTEIRSEDGQKVSTSRLITS